MALPVTTVVPFSTLPSCATLCGHLYDANGACVPPAATSAPVATYDACFCSYSLLQPFKTGTSGVCDDACTTDAGGLGSIQAWFTSFCNVKAVATVTGTLTSSSATSTSTSSGSTNSDNGTSANQTWLSTHYGWVIFLVVMVVAIVGIWVGACFWRRHYLRKKDRQYQLGKHLARASGAPSASGSSHLPQAGVLAPAPISTAAIYDPEKTRANAAAAARAQKERKKWIVKERT